VYRSRNQNLNTKQTKTRCTNTPRLQSVAPFWMGSDDNCGKESSDPTHNLQALEDILLTRLFRASSNVLQPRPDYLELVWPHEEDLLSTRQVVIMLWPISV